jgi:hypothetical protein
LFTAPIHVRILDFPCYPPSPPTHKERSWSVWPANIHSHGEGHYTGSLSIFSEAFLCVIVKKKKKKKKKKKNPPTLKNLLANSSLSHPSFHQPSPIPTLILFLNFGELAVAFSIQQSLTYFLQFSS